MDSEQRLGKTGGLPFVEGVGPTTSRAPMRIMDRSQLSPQQRALLEAAEAASKTANCRYSGYPVGAALLIETQEGAERVIEGNNYETLTYNSVCAEKAALMRAFAEHSWFEGDKLVRPRVSAVAVYCAVGSSPQQPCGDCRQTLHEVNPDIQVISGAGPALVDGEHDPRVTLTTVRELLPYSFELRHLLGEAYGAEPVSHDADDLEEHVVHLPRPDLLAHDQTHRTELLQGVGHLLLVGSPSRARRIAQLAYERLGAALDAEGSCYCDLRFEKRDETSREYAVYCVSLPGGAKVAVASHGIGKAGVEILMSELPAAIALAQAGQAPEIRGVLRSGTRGTLSRVPLGCTALSTRSCDDHLDVLPASERWLGLLRGAADGLGMTRVAEGDIDGHGEDGWPEATSTLVEGLGLSASFFWDGQARPLYRPKAPSKSLLQVEARDRGRKLAAWTLFGVRWIEMEDYTLHRIAALCGYPSATLGAVIAHRRRADGTFQLDYSKEALAKSELIPTEIALRAIMADKP